MHQSSESGGCVTNPNDCHTSAWASAINQIANAINSHPNYHATIIAAHAATPANGLDPSQRGQDILTFCPAGATCPPYQAYPVKGANQLYGYNCRVGGLNTVFGTNRIFGNAPQWVNPAPHGDLGEVSPSASKVSIRLQTWSRPTGTGYFGMGSGAGLFRLADPDADLMVRFPNYLHTYVDTLGRWRRPAGGLSVSHQSCVLDHAGLRVGTVRDGTVQRKLDRRASMRHTAYDLADRDGVRLRRQCPTATIRCNWPGSLQSRRRRKSRSSRNIPVAWNGFFDANNWLHKRIPGAFSHANTTHDVLDFSGPLLALGFYDTQAATSILAGNQCVLNGVAGDAGQNQLDFRKRHDDQRRYRGAPRPEQRPQSGDRAVA